MRDSDFQKLLTRAASCAAKHYDLMERVHQEIKRRYGYEPGDVDADGIIDVINYLGGNITVAEVDREMREAVERRQNRLITPKPDREGK